MITSETISRAKATDLMGLIGVQPKKVASTGGGEFAGECPFCGGRDRFHIQPNHPSGPRWFCRNCTEGVWQDAIDFVKRQQGLNFADAVAHLVGGTLDIPAVRVPPVTLPIPPKVPTPAWQNRALAFVIECQQRLWSDAGKAALSGLHKRGFSDETIEQARLGWNDRTRFEDRSSWGLPAELNGQGNQKRVWLPRGWILPWFVDSEVLRISIRRPRTDLGTERREV